MSIAFEECVSKEIYIIVYAVLMHAGISSYISNRFGLFVKAYFFTALICSAYEI